MKACGSAFQSSSTDHQMPSLYTLPLRSTTPHQPGQAASPTRPKPQLKSAKQHFNGLLAICLRLYLEVLRRHTVPHIK